MISSRTGARSTFRRISPHCDRPRFDLSVSKLWKIVENTEADGNLVTTMNSPLPWMHLMSGNRRMRNLIRIYRVSIYRRLLLTDLRLRYTIMLVFLRLIHRQSRKLAVNVVSIDAFRGCKPKVKQCTRFSTTFFLPGDVSTR